MIFSFGQAEQERIEVDVLGYERAATGEYWDDNWLSVLITVRAGGFRGKADAAIQTSELVKFTSELEPLYESLNGSAEFETMEEQLSMKLVGDGKGHIEFQGELVDQAGVGNRLHFTLHFDQSQLGSSIRELKRVLAQYPVRMST
jgi:hypothetical protein